MGEPSPPIQALRVSLPEFQGLITDYPELSHSLSAADNIASSQILRKIIDLNPSNGPAHLGLAVLLWASGDATDALRHAQAATHLMPDGTEPWRLLADIQRERADELEMRAERLDKQLVSQRSTMSRLKTKAEWAEVASSSSWAERQQLRNARSYLGALAPVCYILPVTVVDAATGQTLFEIEADNFRQVAVKLEALGRLPEANLLRAFAEAKEIDPYDSAGFFYKWIKEGADNARLTVTPATEEFLRAPRREHRNHGIVLTLGSPHASPVEDRARSVIAVADLARQLSWLFDINEPVQDMDALSALRHNRGLAIAEAAMMAAGRYFGAMGRPEEVQAKIADLLDHGLGYASGVRTVHLKAVKHCLEKLEKGEPIPDHLRKFVGDDDTYLPQRICAHPFSRFDMINGEKAPEVRVCCTHWLPTVIGNLEDGAEDVLNSPVVQDIRQSMLDGSFKYCDHLNCQTLINNALPIKSEVNDPVLLHAIQTGDLTVDSAGEILFAIDDTCNLSCPSCRMDVRGASKRQIESLMEIVDKTVLPMLNKATGIMINPAGELMVSEPSRAVLRYISDETCPNLKVRIITNGTRFSEEEWVKFPGIHGKVEYIRVSLDAATRETFEKLRRGAHYEETWKNLAFLSRLRRDRKIDGLFLSFTYQLDNFQELPEFVQLGLALGVDGLLFERLMNMGSYTDEEYRRLAVHMLDHPQHEEFLRVMQHLLMKESIVQGDLADSSGSEAASGWISIGEQIGLSTDGSGEQALRWRVEQLASLKRYGSPRGARAVLLDLDGVVLIAEGDDNLVLEESRDGRHRFELLISPASVGTPCSFSFWCKPKGRSRIIVETRDDRSGSYGVAIFDIAGGEVELRSGDVSSASLEPGKDGWCRVEATMQYRTKTAVVGVLLSDDKDANHYVGDGQSGILVRDFEFGKAEHSNSI